MTQIGLWPRRTNKLVAAAEDCGVDFSTVPSEGDSVLTAVAGCLEVLKIDPQQVLEKIKKDPRQRIPQMVVAWALWDVAMILLFVGYPDDRDWDNGERLFLSKEETNALRQHLKAIVVREGVMEIIDKLHIVQPTQEGDDMGVGQIIRGHAKRELIG